jgi:hypothetical protein
MRRLWFWLRVFIVIILCLPLLGRSNIPPADPIEQIRAFTRTIEFDYITWELDAIGGKIGQASLDLTGFLTQQQEHDLVIHYLELLSQSNQLEAQITQNYSNPSIKDPEQASKSLQQALSPISRQLNQLAPVAESILEDQISTIAIEMGLAFGGQLIPPVSFHSSDTPLALIISPRGVIEQEADISLLPGLTVVDQNSLENQISDLLDVSALVVPIGGIGVYPTMIMNTTDLNWLAETIAHEWTHNFLTLRPLGISYDVSNDLRSMNETVASLVGREVGSAMIRRYYPELAPAPTPASESSEESPSATQENVFDFRAEMHTTRITTDQLLMEGKVSEAESYMEARRVYFWENGYQIRKINQAYFAFYGAYNDVGGNSSGAAGTDPVGPALAALREKSTTLGEFLNQVSWMTSLNQLEDALK